MLTVESCLNKNFIDRGESYKAGMLLLATSLKGEGWNIANRELIRLDLIKKKIEKLYGEFKENLEREKNLSVEIRKKHFDRLLGSYISILKRYTTLKNPFQTLVNAERYSVCLKESEQLETKVDFPVEGANLKSLEMILNEQPVDDKELLLSEYSNENSLWFSFLDQWEKKVIQEIKEKQQEKQGKIYSIPSSLRNVPGLANTSFHEIKIDNKQVLSYFRHATQLPIDLLGKEEEGTEDERFRLTCFNVASQIRQSIEKLKTQGESGSPDEVIILTQSLVSPGKVASLKAKFISGPSDNDTRIYEAKEKAVQLFQTALTKPNDPIPDKVKSIFFTKEEQKKDPLYYRDFFGKWGLIAQNNKTFKYRNQKSIKITLLSTNHPLNTLRYFEEYQPQLEGNKRNTALLLGAVSRHLESFKSRNVELTKKAPNKQQGWQGERVSELLGRLCRSELDSDLNELIEKLKFCEETKELSANHREFIIKLIRNLLSEDTKAFLDENTLQLLHALQSLLSIPSGQGVLASDERHKPLLRSMAEIMILNCLKGGVAWIACKSGKDRTGGASIAVDAAEIYYYQYKQFPQYHDDNVHRENYLKILNELYRSSHQQKVAAKNAPGAEGLIKPACFFPGDLKLEKGRALLETQLACLNKPKVVNNSSKESFFHQVLNDDLQDINDKVNTFTLGTSATLADWQRNGEVYFINDKCVKELREDKKFEDKNDLSKFIEISLLGQIKEQKLKKEYLKLILYSFHQGGFPHAFAKLSKELLDQCWLDKSAMAGQPDMKVDFSWSEKHQSIQIKESNIYKRGMDLETGEAVLPKKGAYFSKTQSCILLKLNEAKEGYELAVSIQSASVNCADELKFLFFIKLNLLEVFIHYLQLLLVAIKRCFDKLTKTSDLNESRLSQANSSFFQESIVATTSAGRERGVELKR